MKKLLNTLYVLSEGNYLTLDGENVVVLANEEVLGRFPLHLLENIVSFTYKGASPALMGACAEHNVGLSFFTPNGKFLARTTRECRGNVLLRKEQYRISDNENESIKYVRLMILGKVFNSRWCLERTLRDHSLRIRSEEVKKVSDELYEKIPSLRASTSLDTLRGWEGELANRYFSVWDELILNQKESFVFVSRNRRPPKDKVNCLLSLTYSVLTNECANALESVGLDPYVGFMHQDRPGRKSLALDIMEELRSVVADRFVLSLINLKIMKPEHFDESNGAVLLTEKGRKLFFTSWQNHKKEQITHPYLKEKVEWGLVPYIQALLLARAVRGDIDGYPPFLWK